MPWVRGGDTSATYPPVMQTAALSGSDDRTVNEVMGFVCRLAFLSAAHTTDYLVDEGTVYAMAGSPTRARELIKICKRVKLLTARRVDGLPHYKIVEDPDFLHLRLKAELEWEAQQQADGKNEALTVPIRLRDGDLCRYCGVMVVWRGRPGKNYATFDHLKPGKAATVDTMVVACKSCNSGWRDVWGREHGALNPPPARPFYSEFTADWLTERLHPVEPTQRPGTQSDTAPNRTTRTSKTRQRPGSQPAHAPRVSDPATKAGHRAQPPTSKTPEKRISKPISQEIGSGFGRVGSGRDGSEGPAPTGAGPTTNTAGTRRRKRSRRGRTGGHPT